MTYWILFTTWCTVKHHSLRFNIVNKTVCSLEVTIIQTQWRDVSLRNLSAGNESDALFCQSRTLFFYHHNDPIQHRDYQTAAALRGVKGPAHPKSKHIFTPRNVFESCRKFPSLHDALLQFYKTSSHLFFHKLTLYRKKCPLKAVGWTKPCNI